MLFDSNVFIFVFLPLSLVAFQVLRAGGFDKVSRLWVIVASFVFYGWWNPIYVLLLAGSIGFNYTIGAKLLVSRSIAMRRCTLAFGITVNIALLAYFKYANFFIDVLDIDVQSISVFQDIILPLAISFFTFQQIAYIVDVYRKETTETSLLNYCLFVSFFPQLIAGPIVHHKEMLPQFAKKNSQKVNWEDLAVGITIFSIGLFKKVVLADGIGVYADHGFAIADGGYSLGFAASWLTTIAFSMQIYFDFSGYSDMAIGLGRMFGIVLPLNFFSPYKATNIIEFWRRWHITLSRFLRDYLYIPLGGSCRGGVSQRCQYYDYYVTWWALAWGRLGIRNLGRCTWCISCC